MPIYAQLKFAVARSRADCNAGVASFTFVRSPTSGPPPQLALIPLPVAMARTIAPLHPRGSELAIRLRFNLLPLDAFLPPFCSPPMNPLPRSCRACTPSPRGSHSCHSAAHTFGRENDVGARWVRARRAASHAHSPLSLAQVNSDLPDLYYFAEFRMKNWSTSGEQLLYDLSEFSRVILG